MKKLLTIAISAVLALGSTQSLVVQDAIIKAQNTQTIISQGGYTLLGSLSDADGDGYMEAPNILNKGADGGQLPLSLAAPKSDGYGTSLKYCAFDNGSIRTNANLIQGSSIPSPSNTSFAIISAGADKTFNTTCADIYVSGVATGDDIAFVSTQSQAATGAVQNTPQFWGAPVANSAALSALDSSSLYDGQVRINKADNTLWRWNSSLAQWQTVTGGQWTTIGTALSYTTGNVLIGTNTDNGIDKLQVNGTVVSNGYRINGYGTVVDASGNWVGQTIPISKGGTGLTALGLPGQILGVNNAGSGLNYRTLAGTTNQISIAISNTQITFSLPQDIAPTSSPTFAGLTLNGQLNANAGIATTTLTASGLIAGQRYNALGGSVTADYPLFAGSQTWNNAGVSFNGIKLNITDTASTVSSSLMDLQVNNVSRFRIAKDGSVYAANIGVSSASLPANGIFAPSANTLGFAAGSTIVASADVTGIDIKSGGLKINGVVVIDSAKNISTTGSVTANGGYKVGTATVIDSGGYLIAANTVTAGTDCTTVGVGGIAKDANGDLYICK